jgi:acyl-CoA thioester hydrolase
MGHMNVRFYLAIAAEGLTGLAAALGLPRAFSPGASSTLVVREHHVRFLKEARPGAGLVMTGGILSIDDCEATLLQLLFHDSGEPAAAVTVRVAHVTPRDLKPFAWTQSTRRLAESLMIPRADFATPRGIADGAVSTTASLQRADAMGLDVTASGAIGPNDCDVFGRMLPEQMLARVYGSVGHLFRKSVAAAIAAAPDLKDRLGGAAVEYRCLYHAWPRAGDRLQLRSGHRAMTPKSRSVVHWLLDPASGRPWATAEVVSLFLDLKTRKSMLMPDNVFAAMAVNGVEGLEL